MERLVIASYHGDWSSDEDSDTDGTFELKDREEGEEGVKDDADLRAFGSTFNRKGGRVKQRGQEKKKAKRPVPLIRLDTA